MTNATETLDAIDYQAMGFDCDRRASSKLARYERIKRTFDVTCSTVLLVALSPLMILIAIAVKLSSPGPVIFRQRRVGKDGVEFWFYKFRSMTINAEEVRSTLVDANQHGENSITFKIKNDPRITKIGRIIRKTSLDELPQIWNVLNGDMSLVGPRPALPIEVSRYTDEEQKRLSVVPGLTCYWQISGRSDLSFDKQVQLDLKYIERRNFWLDLSLLAQTLPAVISGRGAY